MLIVCIGLVVMSSHVVSQLVSKREMTQSAGLHRDCECAGVLVAGHVADAAVLKLVDQ